MDDKLKKRLAGAGVVLLLGFALVSLLPGPGEKTPPDTQQVTIALQAEPEAAAVAPPSDQATPSSLQSAAEATEAALSPAEMEAASGGDLDAPPEPAPKAPVQKTSEPAASAPAAPSKPPAPALKAVPAKPAVISKPEPADKTPLAAKAASEAKPAVEKPAPASNKPVPAPAAVPAKAPAAPSAGNWFVQLGGYADIDNARQVQKQVQGKNLGCIIAPVDTNKGTIYRVRAGPFKDRDQAQAAQTRLSAAGFAAAALVAP